MKWKKRFLVAVFTVTMLVPASDAFAVIAIIDIIRTAVKKVIKQIDLNVQRLQNKTIALQNAQKTLENAMSKAKLKEISQWMEKQRKLYDEYYEELKKVKDAIGTFKTVKDIITRQLQMVEEYKKAYAMFRHDKNFTKEELAFMYRVYTGILTESATNLDRLLMVTNSFQTQMTDGKRMELISAIAEDMNRNHSDLRKFTAQARALAIQRAKAYHQIETTGKLYGLPAKN